MSQVLSDRYLLSKTLGSGGFSSVYQATDTRLDREVAVKILKADLSEQDGMIERFMREAKLTASLKHTHSLQIFDYGHSDNQLYIVSELLTGQALDDIIKTQGSLSELLICQHFIPLCMALHEAHELGIVHRDLKPSNLFLNQWGNEERLVVIDFGISKGDTSRVEKVTKTGQLFGTPHYMSPEQIQRPNQVGPQSDLYSLGIILFELINGAPPFDADTMFELLSEHIKTEPPFLKDLSNQCSLAYANLVKDLLAKNPEKRPNSASEVADRLRVILKEQDQQTQNYFASTMEMSGSGSLPTSTFASPLPNQSAPTDHSSNTSPTLDKDMDDDQNKRVPQDSSASLEQQASPPLNPQMSSRSFGKLSLVILVISFIGTLLFISLRSKIEQDIDKRSSSLKPKNEPAPKPKKLELTKPNDQTKARAKDLTQDSRQKSQSAVLETKPQDQSQQEQNQQDQNLQDADQASQTVKPKALTTKPKLKPNKTKKKATKPKPKRKRKVRRSKSKSLKKRVKHKVSPKRNQTKIIKKKAVKAVGIKAEPLSDQSSSTSPNTIKPKTQKSPSEKIAKKNTNSPNQSPDTSITTAPAKEASDPQIKASPSQQPKTSDSKTSDSKTSDSKTSDSKTSDSKPPRPPVGF